jgi:thiamine-phosphate pyrophosphorylase
VARIDRNKLKEYLKVYFIAGSINCSKKPAEVLMEAIAGGVSLFQFREKGTGAFTGNAKTELAKELQQICREHHIPFIVNDDVELALALDADGVHIGQEDEDAGSVRKRIGDKILGVSAHTMEEVERAIAAGADYLGIGPVFPTKTKEDAREAAGFTLIEQVRKARLDIPIVGIGGINPENCASVIRAGADGVSVISAISGAASPQEAARQIRKNIEIEL